MSDPSHAPPAQAPAPTGPDVFLSYNSADRAWVDKVREALRKEGLTTFFDREALPPGQPWMDPLLQALGSARTVAIFIGPGELGKWQKRELAVALTRQADEEQAGRSFPVIPVLLPGADLQRAPGFLLVCTWVKLQGEHDTDALHTLARAIRESATPTARPAFGELCPYRDLRAFREEDAPLFFGREDFATRLLGKVRAHALVAVVGPSGSGKSSVVMAGLLPLLRRERPPAPTWDAVVMTPGKNPFRSLAAALSSLRDAAVDWKQRLEEAGRLGDLLKDGKVSLHDTLKEVLTASPGTERLLLVVDQFEELFTLTTDVQERRDFVKALLEHTHPDSPLRVVLTLRADYYGQALALERALSDRLQDAQVPLGPMSQDELRRVIERPALASGLKFEPGLVKTLLDDMDKQPGAIPLLEFTLTQLWEGREDGVLRNARYVGVEDAIGNKAQSTFETLTPGRQAAAERVLGRLVRVSAADEEGTDTRQRIRLAELSAEEREIAQVFVQARLLVVDVHASTGEETLEVAHEVLLRAWKHLRSLINKNRDFLLWRQRLGLRMGEWVGANRDTQLLLPGPLLAEASRWARERSAELNPEEREFIARSDRQARQSDRKRQALRVAALTGMLVLVVGTVGTLLWRRSDSYQINALITHGQGAQVDTLSSEGGVETLKAWVKILALMNRPQEAREAASVFVAKSERSRVKALLIAARYLAAVQNFDAAEDLLFEALATNQGLFVGYNKAGLMILPDDVSRDVDALIKHLVNADHAMKLLDRVAGVDDDSTAILLLGTVAASLEQAGRLEETRAFTKKAEERVQKSEPLPRAHYLLQLAQNAAERGHPDEAKELAAQAQGIMAPLELPEFNRINFHMKAAMLLASIGHIEQARALFVDPRNFDDNHTVILLQDYEASVSFAEAMLQNGQARDVLTMASALPTSSLGRKARIGFAMALCTAAEKEGCLELLRTLADMSINLDVFMHAAKTLVAQDKAHQARLLLAHLTEGATRPPPLSLRGGILAKLESDKEDAEAVASQLLVLLVRMGETDQALQLAHALTPSSASFDRLSLSDGFNQIMENLDPLSVVAIQLARQGRPDEARAIALETENLPVRTSTLARLISISHQAGNTQAARDAAADLRTTLEKVLGKDFESHATHLNRRFETAVTLAEVGLIDESLQLARGYNRFTKTETLTRIIATLEKAGRPDEAERIWAELLATASELEISEARLFVIMALADTPYGDRIAALAPQVKDPAAFRSRAMELHSRWQARQGDLLAAARTAEECSSSADKLRAYTSILGGYMRKQAPHLGTLLDEN